MLTTNIDDKCWLPVLTKQCWKVVNDNQFWLTMLTTNIDYQFDYYCNYRYWLPMLTTYCIDNAIWSNITKWLTKSQLVTHWLSNMVWRLLDQETLAHQKIETGESLFRERTPLFCEIHSSLGGHLCPNAGKNIFFLKYVTWDGDDVDDGDELDDIYIMM